MSAAPTIRCLAIPSSGNASFVEISTDDILSGLQLVVGGRLEGYPLSGAVTGTPNRELALYVNEEGHPLGLPRNKNVPNVRGDAVLSILDSEGEDVGFPSEVTVEQALAMLKNAL